MSLVRLLLVAIACLSVASVSGRSLTTLPLSGTITESQFGATVHIAYGYLSAAKALFFNMTVSTNSNSSSVMVSKLGFAEVDIAFNSTFTQAFQFSITPSGLCSWRGFLNLNSSTVTVNANPSMLYVSNLMSPSSDTLQARFQIAPFDLTTTGGSSLPTLSVNVGPATYVSSSYPSCTGYSKMGVIIMAAPLRSFAPCAAQAQITSASSACVFGSHASSAPFGCGTCFPPFAGTRCDQTGATTTNLSPSNTKASDSSPKPLITPVPVTTTDIGLSKVLIIVIIVIGVIIIVAVVVYVERSKETPAQKVVRGIPARVGNQEQLMQAACATQPFTLQKPVGKPLEKNNKGQTCVVAFSS
jgi:hypothetical protein